MTIDDSFEIDGYTVLILSEERPMTDWKALRIDGEEYAPQIVMDAGRNVIAVKGSHDLAGQIVEFV
ncbi:MAG: hypothetical protein Q4B77_05555 [Coriobacteriaceae bacterium]|nr:hypothetical protein [Coriobacteriaceae bacterium]